MTLGKQLGRIQLLYALIDAIFRTFGRVYDTGARALRLGGYLNVLLLSAGETVWSSRP